MPVSPRRQPDRVTLLAKVALGLLTLWPLVYSLFFVVAFLALFLSTDFAIGSTLVSRRMIIVHLGTILLSFALIAIYLVHLFRSGDANQNTRLIWVVLFLTGFGFLAMPIYWYLYIWRGTSQEQGGQVLSAQM